MITNKQRTELKTYLKHGYVADVLIELDKKSILNTKGKPHSESIIRNVFSGRQSNVDIEDAILVIYKKRKAQEKNREKRIKKLLSA